jgi:phosphohistidine phosphatase
MRHGEAVDYREPDHTRALTDVGMSQCENVGHWLHQFLPGVYSKESAQTQTAILPSAQVANALVSPYLRTQQSFEALSKGLKIVEQTTTDLITPNGNAGQVADLIHGYATGPQAPQSLIVITHMPLVSLLADKVCHGFNAKYFDTADTLVIDYDERTGIGAQLAFYQGIDEQKEAY